MVSRLAATFVDYTREWENQKKMQNKKDKPVIGRCSSVVRALSCL